MEEKPYRALAKHLDTLPGGFGPSDTGAHLRLLQQLFTPQQADLAVHLTLDREDAAAIAERAGLPPDETAARLDEMSRQGLIYSVHFDDGPTLYQAAPWVVGIWEFQVNRLTPALARAADDYWASRAHRKRPATIPQMRTIPVGESVTPEMGALPYQRVEAMVDAHDTYAVAPCICRRHARIEGRGCDAPEESCLFFGEFAEYYVQGGRARAIDRDEVMAILTRADEHNLVLQPTNSQRIAAICCCCECCCGILGGIKRADKPAEAVANPFIAQLDPDAFIGCWTCLGRCPMDALTEDGDRVAHNPDRCIGCGLCVTTCPAEALTLCLKPGADATAMPGTFDETWRVIAQQQAGH